MKISKKIFVSSIVLLLTITPLLATAREIEKTNLSSINTTRVNSLGNVTIEHIPLYLYPFTKGGMDVTYDPPPDGFEYWFPEVNGEVLMNFSLKIRHRLPDFGSGSYLAVRYTWINNLIISGEGFEYLIEDKKICKDNTFVTYYLNMTDKPLETNGEDVTLDFYLFGGIAITNSSIIHELMWNGPFFKWIIPKNFLNPGTLDPTPITIHPE